jgi:uncharacterized membrane protein YbhN (UPF0104 family)
VIAFSITLNQVRENSVMNRRRLSHLGTALFSLLLLSLAIWTLRHELKTYSFQDILNSLAALPKARLGLAVIFTTVGYAIMTGYDSLAMCYIRHPLPFRQTALAAFSSFALSNSLGFAFLTSSLIRYRLYSAWGLTKVEIASVIAFGNFSFWLGMLAIGGVLFIMEPLAMPNLLKLPFHTVHPLGVIFLVCVVSYLFLSFMSQNKTLKIGNSFFKVPSFYLSLAQIGISTFDWAIAGAVLYVLLTFLTPLSYPAFFGVYLLAQLAGIISHVPGGLGVFETVIVLLLQPAVSPDRALGALLAYRGIYYFLPFLLGALCLVGHEVNERQR